MVGCWRKSGPAASLISNGCVDFYLDGFFIGSTCGGLQPFVDGGGAAEEPPAQTPCARITGTGGILDLRLSFGSARLEFNASGFLIGFSVPLTGDQGRTVKGFEVPPETLIGAKLESPGTVSLGFSKLARTSGFFGAFIQSATFSADAFTEVIGSVAVGNVALGGTTTPSPSLRDKLNEIPEAINLGRTLVSLLTYVSQHITCTSIFGSGK